MNLRRIKHTLKRLSLEEKVIGLGSIVILIGCFFPWYSTSSIVDKKTLTEYGFSGDLGVIGFVIFLMSLLGLLAMVSENMHLPFPKFGYKRESIVLFFVGQAAFLTLLTMAVYTKRSLDFTNAGLRFGIYLVLAAAFFSALGAFALIRKTRRREVVEFFEHEATSFTNSETETSDQDHFEENTSHEKTESIEEMMTFAEDKEVMDEIEEVFKDPKESPSESQKQQEEPEKKEEKRGSNQANYFTREAGVRENKEEKEKDNGLSMSFYNDK